VTNAPVQQQWNGQLRRISYDPQGNILEEEHAGEHWFYSYDALNRLISANRDRYEYDSLGNLTKSIEDGVTTTYTYNLLNQQIFKTEAGKTPVINTFDNRGNLTASNGATYTYDATNRMVQGDNNGETSEYTYNGLGYLIAHNGKSFVLDYTSLFNNVIMEQELTSSTRNVYGLRQITAGTLYVHLDRLGSTRQVTGIGGAITARITYNAWGKPGGDTAWASYTGHSYDAVLYIDVFGLAPELDAEHYTESLKYW
jgi:YD repeat-containing protein